MAKKQAGVEGDAELDTGLPAQAGEARVYELGFHLDPELSTEEAKNAYQAIRAPIEAAGEIVAEGEPEKIPLAYTISRGETAGRRDFDSAYFAWIAYETPMEAHAEVVKAAGADKRIVRFIDLATDKETARVAAERTELAHIVPPAGEPPPEATADDVVLDAALESATL
jgi:ribosomal protein S6